MAATRSFTNRYDGDCGSCGNHVPAGTGLCQKVNGKFTAYHLGPCPAVAPAAPTAPTAPAAPRFVPTEGFYLVDDATVIRVYVTKRGNMASKTLELPAPGVKKGRWNYTGQRPFALCTADKELTIATAAVFGLTFGVCARCGIVLDRPESKAVGYGPVCAKLLGVPHSYGKAPVLADLPAAKADDDLAAEWGDLVSA